MMSTVHVPILVQPIIDSLIVPFQRLPPGSQKHWWVDCTLGGGGHTEAFLQALRSQPETQKHSILSIDQDAQAVERAKIRFANEIKEGRLVVCQGRFGDLESLVGDRLVLGCMADLGFSSDQMEDAQRGLSFLEEGPLDMRLDQNQGETCYQLLSRVRSQELEKILLEYGEERFAKRISTRLIALRNEGNLPQTTKELSRSVIQALPPQARHGRIHAATRTFQALRIAVNHELDQLDQLLNQGISKIKTGGRIAILSFHSLEDRRVKEVFKNRQNLNPLTKKPIQASEEEQRLNPRSRSAKLRIAEVL